MHLQINGFKPLRMYEIKTVNSSALQKLPEDLQYMTYLREWHIHRTLIQKLPEFIEQFVDLCVLNIPKNKLTQLPAEIGQFITVLYPLFIFFFIYIRSSIIVLSGINESIIVNCACVFLNFITVL